MKYFLFIIRQLILYARFVIQAKNRRGHGIHSPFVYKFCRQVLIKKVPDNDAIEEVRRQQKRNYNKILFSDLGAGSLRQRQSMRPIAHLAKHATNKKKNKFLFKLVQFIQPIQIIELGTSLGFSTMYMASASPAVAVYTVEGVPQIAEIASKTFQKLDFKNIQLIEGDFMDEFPALMKKYKNNTLTFIDGNHTCDATLYYFDLIMQQPLKENVVVIDDIRWSKGMYTAWKKILKHKRVSLSIDLYYLGIVFLDRNMAKQSVKFRF